MPRELRNVALLTRDRGTVSFWLLFIEFLAERERKNIFDNPQ